MRTLFLLIIVKFNFLYSQSINSVSVNKCIDSLSWTSFNIAYTYFGHLNLSKSAERLVGLNDTTCIYKLFDNLSNSSRTVVIHIILTKTFNIKDTVLSESYEYKDSLIGSPTSTVNYSYNNLTWQYDVKTGNYSIQQSEIKKIINFWYRFKSEISNKGFLSPK